MAEQLQSVIQVVLRVQRTWPLVEADMDAVGLDFFVRIFTAAPGALALFSFRNEPDYLKSPALKRHARQVMEARRCCLRLTPRGEIVSTLPLR